MVSKYFELTVNTDKFKKETKILLKSLSEKKVIVYGAGQGYFALNKLYDFKEYLKIVAVADRKFEADTENITGLKQITPRQILREDFDIILVTNEQPREVLRYLTNSLEISEEKIVCIFKEEIKEEALNLNYLYEQKFDKTLPKLIKKLKNKRIVIYGAGIYFETILKYFDLSGLNIIGVADKKFEGHDFNKKFLGFNVIAPSEITDLRPDYVLVATKFYISLIENLYKEIFKNTKIKIKPLVKKSLFALLEEVWK